MNSVPLTTKILVVLLVIVGVRFVFILSGRFSGSEKVEVFSQQKIATPEVEQILTCQQYSEQIKTCTSEAMVCLKQIEESKKFYEDNEVKILSCQSENEKNFKINQQLKVKLDVVTEKLEQLIGSRQTAQPNTQSQEL